MRHSLGCRSFRRHCEAHFHETEKKILCGLCSVQGGFPLPPPPPFFFFFYWILLRNANLLASSPVNNCSMAPYFETHAVLLDLYVIWLEGDVHHTKVDYAFNTPYTPGSINNILTAHAAGVSKMFSNQRCIFWRNLVKLTIPFLKSPPNKPASTLFHHRFIFFPSH